MSSDPNQWLWNEAQRLITEREPYTCVARNAEGNSACVFYPRTQITGELAWVDESVRAVARTQVSYHRECVKGFWYVTQDGKQVSPFYPTEALADLWVQQHQGQSNDYAYKYGGYALKQAD